MQEEASSVFEQIGIRVVELDTGDLPCLQEFFNLNPEYFLAVSGQAAAPDEAAQELYGPLPEGWPYTKKWLLGFVDSSNTLIGMSNLVSDLLAPGVWHIGLFMISTSLHGKGMAHKLYQGLEIWARDSGASWLRLGVVQGNVRAEKFWEKLGYTEVRMRQGVEIGQQSNTVRVMAKPLAGGDIAEYLQLVLRDDPSTE